MKMTKRDMILLAVIGAIAVVGGFYWFVAKPAKADLKAQKDELAQIQNENADLTDTLSRMADTSKGEAKRTAERLRIAKALPEATEAPGVVVQLQKLADQANVELTSIKTNSYSDYGSIRGTEFEVRVTGEFFDVDDFLYRLHRQVAVDEKDRPIVGGRLFATTSVDLTLDQDGSSEGGAPKGGDSVVGTVKVVAFSSVPGGAAAGTSSAPATTPGTAVSAPAATTTTGTTSTPAPATTTGPAQTTATPSSGGTQ